MLCIFIFACIINYCVEKTAGNCQNKCSSLPGDFQSIDHLPDWTDDIDGANVYVSEDVGYSINTPFSQYSNFILCDDSTTFTYSDSITEMTLKSYFVTNFKSDFPASLKFRFEDNLSLIIDEITNMDVNIKSIILEATNPNLYISPMFLTDTYDCYKNKFIISQDSNTINIYDINDQFKSLFTSFEKLKEVEKIYYCISDKEQKCSDYSSYNPKVIESTSEIVGDSVVLIVESTNNQIYSSPFKKRYIKFIGLENSHIIYDSYFENTYQGGEFKVIINEDSIAMSYSSFEGKGSFTLSIPGDISLFSTTEQGSIDFTIAHERLMYYHSHVRTISDEEKEFSLSKKIKVPDFCMFYGSGKLKGLFEEGKYLEIPNIPEINDISQINQFEIEGLDYRFADGEYEIPQTWNKGCHLGGTSNTKFIFRNVHSLNYNCVDELLYFSSENLVIYPSKFLFVNIYQEFQNLDIIINGDLIISGYISDDNLNINCNFKGTGTVKFLQSDLRSKFEQICKKEETVNFEDTTSLPNYYICVGQSNLDECKKQIDNVDEITDAEWIWIVNTITISSLKNVKRAIYITDNQIYRYYNDEEIILTNNAELSIRADSITISQNNINNIISQSNTAKLNMIVSSNSHETDKKLKLKYIRAPTGIDLNIYFSELNVFLFLNMPDDYVQNSIKIHGNSDIYLREYQINLVDVFKSIDPIKFLENNNQDYECLCYADNFEKCKKINDDFKHVTTLEDIINYKNEYYYVNAFSPLTIDIGLNPGIFFSLYEGSSLDFDIPDKARIIFGRSRGNSVIEIVSEDRSQIFIINDENVEIVFRIKNTIYLSFTYEHDDATLIPSFSLITEEKSIEIFPSLDLSSKVHQIKEDYKIKINDGVSIKSPMPEYLDSLFNSASVTFSGICIYLNEEGKSLCGTKESKSFDVAKSESINTKNIIITTGVNTTFSIPSTWTNEYLLYFVNSESAKLNLENVNSLSYYSHGVVANEKYTIVAADINVDVSSELTFNVDLPKGYPIIFYMYYVYLDCSANSQTNFYAGYLSGNQIFRSDRCIHVGGFDVNHKLTVYFDKEENLRELYGVALLYGDEKGMNYIFGGYNYICFASSDTAKEKCTESNYYLVSDISSLINSVSSYPDLTVVVTKNLNIPESTGKSFLLKPFDENIEVTIPKSPISVKILENNVVQVDYDDNSFVKTLNKMNIIINIKDNLELSVSGNLQSIITFELNSNVIISTQSQITETFSINVVKNGFHLYAYDVNKFGSIFGDSLEEINGVCGYADNSESLCTYEKKGTFENVFKLPFNYDFAEIAITSKDIEITLPSIEKEVPVDIRSEGSASLIINAVSNSILSNKMITINNFWMLKENINIISIKVNKQSSLAINEQINSPITIHLTDSDSTINLKNCINQDKKIINLIKFGEKENTLTIEGNDEAFNNFKSLLISYEGITLKQLGKQKYLCVCKDDSCNKCSEGIDGIVSNTERITSDPGVNVEIRIFNDIEVESNLFTHENNVVINSLNTLIVKSVKNVYQNIPNKLKVDNLIFSDSNNLIIKPNPSSLNIMMATQKAGIEFTIEFSTYLVLNVINADEEGIVPSKIIVKGNGELNLHDYPYNKVEAESTVRVIKGAYVICNSQESTCAYQTVKNYNVINIYDDFENEFDKDTKIIIILDTYAKRIDVNINKFRYQQLMFIKQGFSSRLLENNAKVRILSTSVLTNKADLTMNLDGSVGGLTLSNDDSDFIIVAFDDKLTIKQEGIIESTLNPIVVQPQNEKATIVIDNNVKIDNQKIKIETNNEKLELTVFVGDKPTNDDNIKNFLDISEGNEGKIDLIIKEGKPDDNYQPTPKNKKLKPGEIVGIVVGVVVFVAIVVIITLIIIKKKKNLKNSSAENSASI